MPDTAAAGARSSTFIPHLICETCGAKAYIARRRPKIDGDRTEEWQTFQCSACDWFADLVVEVPRRRVGALRG